ncbi:MAG: serine/threonine protein kinase [Anaerolineae bacterium]|nr:serine/threonine protein kinase [Gloeobacterales cyanobacterium ES-bin-313]
MTKPETPNDLENLQRLFELALDQPPEQRSVFLAQACDGDAHLKAQVQALLACDQEEGFLDRPLICPNDQPSDMLGRRIGPYQLKALLGEGGMGEVYLAERDDGEFHKWVAIKFLRVGPGYKLLAGRFESERQILAQLEHPNIVHLLDGGRTEEGHLYLVMEYVDGLAIDEHCQKQGLNVPDRLKLFLQVCEGVEHAHRNLVVHRDLKPANILVTDAGQPKLLDFGIARLLAPDIFHRPFDPTITVLRAATPRYASPEQIKGGVITTASDVYSLGVLLYELLSGRSPYRKATGTTLEVSRAVLEEDPERPSRAVLRTDEPDVRHGFIPKSFRLGIEGDLDNIILKALNKEPSQRYPSVEVFAQDIHNFLEGRPVSARTPTWDYVISKFVGRYPWQVGAAAMSAAVLIGGATALAWQAQVSNRRFEQVRTLAHSLVYELDPALEKISGATSARKLLVGKAVTYLNGLSKEAGGDSELQDEIARGYERLGNVQGSPAYSNLGDIQGGLASYRNALAIRRSLATRTPGDPKAQDNLAICLQGFALINSTTGRLQESLELQSEALAIRKNLYEADPSNIYYLDKLLGAYDSIGGTRLDADDLEQAEQDFRVELALAERQIHLDPQSEEAALNIWYASNNLALVFSNKGAPVQALVYSRRALEEIEQLATRTPSNVVYQRYLVGSYIEVATNLGNPERPNLGDWQAALTTYKKALRISNQLAAADPADSIVQSRWGLALQSVGEVLLKYGSLSDAMQNFRMALQIRQKLASIDQANASGTWDLAVSYHSIGNVLLLQGKLPDALENFTHALKIRRALFKKQPTNNKVKNFLAQTFLKLGEAHEKLIHIEHTRADKKLNWYKARDAYLQILQLQLPPASHLHLDASQGLRRCIAALNLLQGGISSESNNLSQGIGTDAQK